MRLSLYVLVLVRTTCVSVQVKPKSSDECLIVWLQLGQNSTLQQVRCNTTTYMYVYVQDSSTYTLCIDATQS